MTLVPLSTFTCTYHCIFQDICMPKRGGGGQEDTCEIELIRNFKWSKELKFVSDNVINVEFIQRLVRFIHISLPVERYNITLDIVNISFRCRTQFKKSCCVGSCGVLFINKAEMTPDATDRLKADVAAMNWMYQEGTRETVTTVYDLNGNPYLKGSCNNTFQSISIDLHEHRVEEKDNFVIPHMNKIKTRPNEVPNQVKRFTAVTPAINGSQTLYRLVKWESQYTFTNQTNETNVINKDSDKHNDDWSAGTILTYVTIGISCCLLLLTIVVYSRLGMFKSQPGIISKHMMGNMLAAQLLFIGGVGADYVEIVCSIIGIISHFLWLCSFTWISVFLLNVWKVFRMLESDPGTLLHEYKLSKVYYCFGYLLPIVIVLTCSLLDIFTEINIGYSSDNICFPTGYLANLFSFTLPVLLLLFTNVVTLIGTSVAMSRYNSTVNHLKSVGQVRSFIPIYIRLCILSACPWILGIIADIIQSRILQYVYILLAGSHGTFVGFTFLLTQSVRKWAKCNGSLLNRKTDSVEMEGQT